MTEIERVDAREILDARGQPTLEVEVTLDDGATGRASVPSGDATEPHGPHVIRDGGKRFAGRGVRKSIDLVSDRLARVVQGADALDQAGVDALLTENDGSVERSRLGAHAMLGVSMAVARAAADAVGLPLWRYLGGVAARTLPVPLATALESAPGDAERDYDEVLVAPVGAATFADALRISAEVFVALGEDLERAGLPAAQGTNGGYAPRLPSVDDALTRVTRAVERAGYTPGEDVVLGLRVGAAARYDAARGTYRWCKSERDRADHAAQFAALAGRFALRFLEDGAAPDDWEAWVALGQGPDGGLLRVGADLFGSQRARVVEAGARDAADAALVQLHQCGTLSDAVDAMRAAERGGMEAYLGQAAGETEDGFLADLAVARNASALRIGAPSRGERTAKYNQLLRIEWELGAGARYAGRAAFEPR